MTDKELRLHYWGMSPDELITEIGNLRQSHAALLAALTRIVEEKDLTYAAQKQAREAIAQARELTPTSAKVADYPKENPNA